MKIFDDTKIPILSKALDAYALRHKVISTNLANITTVGYHTQSVSFEKKLNGAMTGRPEEASTTSDHHLAAALSQIEEVAPTIIDGTEDGGSSLDSTASGINDVDIDREMTELAKNQLRFKFASRMLSESFRALEKSIKGQS